MLPVSWNRVKLCFFLLFQWFGFLFQSDEEPMSTSTMDTVSSTSTLTTLLRSPTHSSASHNHSHLIAQLMNNPSASSINNNLQHTNGSQTFASLLNDSETNSGGCSSTPLLQNALQNNVSNGLIDARHIKRENSVAAANPLLAGEYCRAHLNWMKCFWRFELNDKFNVTFICFWNFFDVILICLGIFMYVIFIGGCHMRGFVFFFNSHCILQYCFTYAVTEIRDIEGVT